MRDLAFIGFLLALFGFGFRRPFLFVLHDIALKLPLMVGTVADPR